LTAGLTGRRPTPTAKYHPYAAEPAQSDVVFSVAQMGALLSSTDLSRTAASTATAAGSGV